MMASFLVVAVTALTRNVVLGYFATIFIVLHFSRGSNESEKIAFYFAIVFTLTMSAGLRLDFGVNLGSLNFSRLLILTLLLPMLFGKKDSAMKKLNAIDKAVILFLAWQFLLNFRITPFTGAVRMNLWLVVDYLVPYLALRYFIRDYNLLFAAITFALLSQMFLACFEGLMSWHVHTHLERLAGFAEIKGTQYKVRHGFLRVQTSFSNPLTFALFGNVAFLCAVVFFKRIGFSEMPKMKLFTLGLLGVTALGTFFSGSRAGIAGLVLVYGILMVLLWAIKRKKDPKKMMITGALVVLVVAMLSVGDYIKEEFGYRYLLLEVSTGVIADNFLFGSLFPTSDPRMEVLRQGEGIIDIVNTYLHFALFYGVPALLLFVFALFTSMNRLYNYLREAEGEKLTIGVFAFVSLVLLAFNIGTTSAIGWTYPWIWMTLCIASNIVARAEVERRAKSVESRPNLL
ncbi:MAG: O-antigen ligase family protein [Agarilytica sp.]